MRSHGPLVLGKSILLWESQRRSTTPLTWKPPLEEPVMITKMFLSLAIDQLLVHSYHVTLSPQTPHYGRFPVDNSKSCLDQTCHPHEFSLMLGPRDILPVWIWGLQRAALGCSCEFPFSLLQEALTMVLFILKSPSENDTMMKIKCILKWLIP